MTERFVRSSFSSWKLRRLSVSLVLIGALSSCGGGDDQATNPIMDMLGMDNPPPAMSPGAFATDQSTSRFLTQSTFGPSPSDVSSLSGTSASSWFVEQLEMPITFAQPELDRFREIAPDNVMSIIPSSAPTFAFWKDAVQAPDQLRMRMAFALSQILVVSDAGGEILRAIPEGMTTYQDILRGRAFGNYRDLLEDVTYSPAMGEYLTFIGNRKADQSGRVPDENYARELLQLFTVGLVELQPNGEPRLVNGQEVELFDNSDITGLARVFTGLDLAGVNRADGDSLGDVLETQVSAERAFMLPMEINEEFHSSREKTFLNCSISAGTAAAASIDQALDCIMAHPNVGPFVSRQLIQRFTTSNPSPAYVQRVAAAFDAGSFVLPDGRAVGDGRKGDLAATLAAILFDEASLSDAGLTDPEFGKIREPVLRFTQWARAFNVDATNPEYALELLDTSFPETLSQHPYRARSVFNFYRPGFVAPGSISGSRGLNAPEFQLVNATSINGYINYMSFWSFGGLDQFDESDIINELNVLNVPFDLAALRRAWRPDYTAEIALADNPSQLVGRLNRVLAYDTLSPETISSIETAVGRVNLNGSNDTEGLETRVGLAVYLVINSPDFLVQK